MDVGDAGDSMGTAGEEPEEGGDDVKSVWPLCPGLHTRYNGRYRGKRPCEGEQIPKTAPSSECRLKPACMKEESLVITYQLWGGEYVPGLCTHRPSRHGSRGCLKPHRGWGEGKLGDWGEVVTR
jgi:hypothetical protein